MEKFDLDLLMEIVTNKWEELIIHSTHDCCHIMKVGIGTIVKMRVSQLLPFNIGWAVEINFGGDIELFSGDGTLNYSDYKKVKKIIEYINNRMESENNKRLETLVSKTNEQLLEIKNGKR